MYTKVKNDAENAYLHNLTIDGTVGYKYEKLAYNMQIICHIEEEKDVYGSN